MKKSRLLTAIFAWLMTLGIACAQTTVTTHWALSQSIKDLTPGTTAYANATAATISYVGTDVSKMFTTSVSFGSKLAFQGVITPPSYETKETGLALLRFKTQGAGDGTDDHGMTLTIQPTDGADLTFVPTEVSVSVASWVKNSNAAFDVLVRKLNASGEVSQEYPVGTVNSHSDVDAQYDDVTFNVPTSATASKDAWQVVVRLASGYANGQNLAMGNVTLKGTATLGGTVQTSSFSATVSPAGAGTVSPATTSVVTGDNVICTATPNIGYEFDGWYQDDALVATDNPHTFTINSATNVEAKFSKLPEATLIYGPTDATMGSVSVSEEGDNGRYNAGTTLTLTATANKGHYFVCWEDADGNQLSTSEQYTFTLNNDQTVKARFAMIDNYIADLAAFPGCEGYGRFTTGGRTIDQRGSKVYYVTRLDDCSDSNLVEGTLRWALKTGDDTPRTVIFRVCGTIYLTSKLTSVKPNVTIAGQTAPGGGICIAGYQMKLSSNTIVRYIRFRAGDLPNDSMSPLDIENVDHIVLDHCSFSWSMEENMTMYDTDYTTTQWCIFSEGLYYSKNVKGERGYGMQWGGEHGTMHHCLIANNDSRSPRFNGVRSSVNDRQVDNEFANNVIYNWGRHNSIYGGENSAGGETDYDRVYMINNYYRPGPATKNATADKRSFVAANGNTLEETGQWYLNGNKFELSSKWAPTTNIWTDEELSKVNAYNYYGFLDNNASCGMAFYRLVNSQALWDRCILTSLPYDLSGMTYETADEAFASVTTKAGVSLPRYDEVDERILAEAAGTRDPQYGGKRGAGLGIIDSPADITLTRSDEFYALDEATHETIKTTMWPWLGMEDDEQLMQDTDLDGMPDAYETSIGLNPKDASDASLLTESGYSNLEIFLNGVADGTIDLTPYKQKQTVEKRNPFSATVSATDLTADFQTISAAVADAEQKATEDTPYYIFIKAGTYNEHVTISKPYIHLTGQSRESVVITDNKNKDYNGNIGLTATVYVNANDVSLDNLTIANTYGSGAQALALFTLGDRISVTQCHITGWQDTFRTGKSGQRHLVRECLISGATDFIYNAGDVFFDSDTLELANTSNVAIVAPSHITPTWGYVFRDAVITTSQTSATTNLGRPWGDTPMVSFIDTKLADNVSINAAGWVDMGGLPVQMAEYNTTDAFGKAVDLSKRKTTFTAGGETCTSKAVLTEAEAATYTIQNVLSGSDQWDADATGCILDAPQLTVSDTQLTWTDPTGQAACFLVITDGVALLTTDTQAAYDGSSQVSIQSVSEQGVLGRIITPEDVTSVNSIQQGNANQTKTPSYNIAGQRQGENAPGIHVSKGKKYIVPQVR